MDEDLNNDALLRQLGGCGQFQVALGVLASLPYMSASFSAIFMSFGLVNPGWRCLDNNNNTTNANNSNSHNGGINTTINDVIRRGELFNQTMTTFRDVSDNYTESCVGFNTMSCQHIEFSPESSTIVTEWGLVCDKSWIPAIIITIEEAGTVVGGFFGGYLGDRFGRKRTLYASLFIHGVLNLLSVLCTSWHLFAAVRFFTGVSCSAIFGITFVYTAEFVSPTWRPVMSGLPLWTTGCFIFFIITYFFKNWKYLLLFNGAFSLLSVVPALAVLPESLRWLIVTDKPKKSLKAVSKIAKMNKVPPPNETCIALTQNRGGKQLKKANYPFIYLFRKGLRLYTIILGFGYFWCDGLYFATSFGLSALPGDFYVNGIIVFVCEFPGNVIAWFAPNIFGRRPTAFLTSLICSFCLFAVVAIDRFGSAGVQEYGILAMVILARTMTGTAWYTMVTCSNELFPAVARSNASGWRLVVAGFGIMASPYLIPSDGSDLFIPFLVMAVFPLISAFTILLLPETKGKALEDTIGNGMTSQNNKVAV